jgi:hypothetical protein
MRIWRPDHPETQPPERPTPADRLRRIESEIRGQYAPRLLRANLLWRFVLQARMRREIADRLEKLAPVLVYELGQRRLCD